MFSVIGVSVRFGASYLFEKVNLTLNLGTRYGLVGANGCGKSTFLKVLSLKMKPEAGEVVKPKLATIGVLRQDYYLLEKERIVDVVLQGRQVLWEALKRQQELLDQEHLTDEHIEELGEIEECLQKEGGYSAENEAAALLEGLGIDKAKHEQPLETLSGGYKIRTLLAQLLFAKPTLLLLDEPTNYLDIISIRWLEGYLQSFPGTVVICSHDRSFLNNTCEEIIDIDYGIIKVYKGDFELFIEQKANDILQRGAALGNIDKKQQQLQAFADRFGAKASKAKQAQSKLKAVERLEEDKQAYQLQQSSRGYPYFDFKMGSPSGVIPLEIKNFQKSFGSHRLFHHLSFEMHRKDRLVIVGPNGVGKSTLLHILVGELAQDQGELKWGANVRIGYFPQHFEKELLGFDTVIGYLTAKHPELTEQRIRSMLGQMLFPRDDVYKKVDQLSGGEKARLVFAHVLLSDHNFLILDEPTNHLDLESCEALAEALAAYEGTVLFVSHNRYFIGALANRVIEITREGHFDFKGSYEEYIQEREIDYLNAKSSLQNKVVKEEKTVNKSSDKQSNSDKKLKEIEHVCQQKELELEKFAEIIAKDSFYTKLSELERNQVLKKRSDAQSELALYYAQWESLLNNNQKT